MRPPAVVAATITTELTIAHTKNNSNAKVIDAPLWDFILCFMAFMRHHLRVCCWWVVTGQGYSSTGSSLFRILSVPSTLTVSVNQISTTDPLAFFISCR